MSILKEADFKGRIEAAREVARTIVNNLVRTAQGDRQHGGLQYDI